MNQQLFNVPAYYLVPVGAEGDFRGKFFDPECAGRRDAGAWERNICWRWRTLRRSRTRRALEKADQVALRQAKDSHEAGVGTNLDVLRARVQLQTQQQAVINNENTFAKDKIALNRLIGLPADQEITLTDTAPYAEYAELSLRTRWPGVSTAEGPAESAGAARVATQTQKAVKAERLPMLAFDGYYGVMGEIGGLYHGVVCCDGEGERACLSGGTAARRARGSGGAGDCAAAADRVAEGVDRAADTVGDAGCPVANELVKVARSNVDLATQELQDASDRFTAGVDDNLPVVQAQAVLASGAKPAGGDAVSVQPVEADAGAEYRCGGVAVQGLSGAVV